jgi:serine/threonine-protein kinase
VIGKTLGKYRIVEQIGQGGMAEVYKAYHPNLDRYVAIKLMHTFLAKQEGFLERFRREAQGVARLRHPNIVLMHDFDVEGDVYYMVMEYLQGPSLKRHLAELEAQSQWLSLPEALRIVCDVGEALDYAHGHAMFHRDVKPANIVLAPDGKAILTDFGIVKMLGASTQLTASGALIGTPAYMAPEQCTGAAGDARADVYSLGIVLYQLVTRRLPYDADTPMAVVFKQVSAPLPVPSTLNPDLPPGIERILLRALAKDPEDRYQSVREMLDHLDRVIQGLSVPEVDPSITLGRPAVAHAPAPKTIPVPSTTPPARRPAWWIFGLIGLALVAAIIIIGLVLKDQDTAAPPASPTNTSHPTATPNQTATSFVATQSAFEKTLNAPTATAAATATATATPTPIPTATATATAAATPANLVYVPAGEFWMGSDDDDVDRALQLCETYYGDCQRQWSENEHPAHTVRLDSFWMDRTEVTNAQYRRCVQAGVCTPPAESRSYTRETYYEDNGYDDHPVVHVTWEQADAYCRWSGGQLPTEAQWEYAARGPQGWTFPWGDEFDGARLNYCDANCEFSWEGRSWTDQREDDGYGDTAPAGSYPLGASWCGALDMAGNVWEWVSDWYNAGYYARSPSQNPLGPDSGAVHVLRGGSWNSVPGSGRGATRERSRSGITADSIGFRCVRPSDVTVVPATAPPTTLQILTGTVKTVWSVAWSPDGTTLATGASDDTARLWRASDGALLKTLDAHTGAVTSVAFSPDGTTLASGAQDNTVRLWRVDDGMLLHTLKGHTDWLTSVTFSPDGATLASGADDGVIRLWRVSDGAQIHEWKGSGQLALSVAFAPDGTLVAWGSSDGKIQLLQLPEGMLLQTLREHTGWVRSVAFAPDGTTLASGSWDDTVRLWRVSDGALLRTLEGHTDNVRGVAFSHDGTILASASEDNTVRLWRAPDGTLLRVLQGHTGRVMSVAFSPDQTLASGADDGTLRLWKIGE